jgi:hypothetical protein
VLTVGTASAHNGTITITCSSVTFSYDSFGSGLNSVDEKVFVDGALVVDKSGANAFTFTGSDATDVVPLNLSGDHNVSATADWTIDGGGHAEASQTLSCGGGGGGKTPQSAHPAWRAI